MKLFILSIAILGVPALTGLTLGRAIQTETKTETKAEFKSCTTDIDCLCMQGYAEPEFNSPECVEYRGAK